MKSKLYEFPKSSAQQQKMHKTFEFVNFYKPSSESYVKLAEKRKSDESSIKDSTKNITIKHERSPNKNRRRHKQESVDILQINIDGSNLIPTSSGNSPTKISSTDYASTSKSIQANKFKSILKNNHQITEHLEETTTITLPSNRSKKRNKSVSFMLDDNEDTIVKKTKSNESLKVEETRKSNVRFRRKNVKKFRDQESEKENKTRSSNNPNMEVDSSQNVQKIKASSGETLVDVDVENRQEKKKKKFRKVKNQKSDENQGLDNIDTNHQVSPENTKIPKKKKFQTKLQIDMLDTDGEPASKSRKKDTKEDIAEDLENLSIGDNAHTLMNLLDEMTIIDNTKQKKLRHKVKKNKKPKALVSSSESQEPENIEVEEKIKWKNRKWNKDKKGDISKNATETILIVENLPLSLLLNYKKSLTEHFVKYGLIKNIGIAEVYPSEDSNPVFTTTVNFYSDGAAEQALVENNAQFEGVHIRVRRPLPATKTTAVVQSYAELTEQAIISALHGAGRIRNIRILIKGKKSINSAFVEFDGPESVARAVKMAEHLKIGGKKAYVTFFVRQKKKKQHKGEGDSAADADSEDSND